MALDEPNHYPREGGSADLQSHLAALGAAVALSSAVLLITPTASYAIIPADGGAGSAGTAKQKEAEGKKAKKKACEEGR
jgi:hypothetical protein